MDVLQRCHQLHEQVEDRNPGQADRAALVDVRPQRVAFRVLHEDHNV